MGLAAKTPLASPDHYQAVQITDAAVFYSRLSKWDEQFEGLAVHTIQRQVWFPLGFSSLSLPVKSEPTGLTSPRWIGSPGQW